MNIAVRNGGIVCAFSIPTMPRLALAAAAGDISSPIENAISSVQPAVAHRVNMDNGNAFDIRHSADEAAAPLVKKEITSDRAIYPGAPVKQRQVKRAWTRVKSGE